MSAPPDVAERAVLASVLMDPPCIADIADVVTAADFSALDHRNVYAAMIACHSRGHRADLVTVADELGTNGHDHLATDIYLIVTDPDVYVTSANVSDYANRVVKHSRRRSVMDQATALIQQLHADTEADPVELAHQALSSISQIAASDTGPQTYAEVMQEFQQRFTDQHAGLWEERVFRTGLHGLDQQLSGGFRDGELVYLAGRPGSGKTAMALQIAHNGARRNEPVLIFSGEMSMRSLVERGFSEMSSLPMDVIRKQVLPRDQYDALMKISERMAKMPVAIDDTSGLTTSQMLVRAQRFQRTHGLAAIFFDYVELAGDQSKQGETQRLGIISRQLKHIARTCGVPFVALSQLNRGVESRTPPIPRMSDLRQSGSLEQDADIVLLLYRHDYYSSQGQVEFDPDKAGIADIYISKQRNGPEGRVSVRFDEASMRFTNLDEPIPERKAS